MINWGDKGNGQTYFSVDGDGERDNILVWRLDGEGVRNDNMSFLEEELFEDKGEEGGQGGAIFFGCRAPKNRPAHKIYFTMSCTLHDQQ